MQGIVTGRTAVARDRQESSLMMRACLADVQASFLLALFSDVSGEDRRQLFHACLQHRLHR